MEEKDGDPSLLPRLFGDRDLRASTYVKGLAKLALEYAPRFLINHTVYQTNLALLAGATASAAWTETRTR